MTGNRLLEDPYAKSRAEFSMQNKDFETNQGRIKPSSVTLHKNRKGKVIYWMNREYRAQGMVVLKSTCSFNDKTTLNYGMNKNKIALDNWSLIYAQELANRYQLELEVVSFLNVLNSGYYRRHYDFMIDGLIELEKVPFPLEIQNNQNNWCRI